MPFDDWQFHLVTLFALLGAWIIVRPFLPRRRIGGRGRRAQLTIGGRGVGDDAARRRADEGSR